MAPILASTRSVFFQQYDYQFEPRATLYTEFYRLARSRKWKQESNSQKFEKAWGQCFGPDIPVGCNIDRKEDYIRAQYAEDDADFPSMLRALQSLDLGGRTTTKTAKPQRVVTEFASHYGSNDRVIEKWQALCQDCGVNPVSFSINQCKKVQLLPSMCPADNLSH
ncbi:hypothetical protein MMC27_008879 [Xylographa pallens]|nr:hypothetical protein [Xylographa pallens]